MTVQHFNNEFREKLVALLFAILSIADSK